jgi:hypothetical protein
LSRRSRVSWRLQPKKSGAGGAVASDDHDEAGIVAAGCSVTAAAAWDDQTPVAAKVGCVVARAPARATAERAKRSMCVGKTKLANSIDPI